MSSPGSDPSDGRSDGPSDERSDETADGWTPPTEEQLTERARRADKATRGAMAGLLVLEAIVALLIPRAIARTSGLGLTRTVVLIAVAVVLVLGAGVVRRSWGIAVGSGLQLMFFLTGALILTMFLVGAIFAAIWLRLLVLRHEVIGGPGGVRLLAG